MVGHGNYIIDDEVHSAEGVNASGNSLTVPINDAYTQVCLAQTIYEQLSEYGPVTPHDVFAAHDVITFGDDSVVLFKDPRISVNRIFTRSRDFNLHITHADKLPHGDDYTCPPEEITFLKRFFRPLDRSADVVLAPLEMSSILSSVSHCKLGSNSTIRYSQRVLSALREASLYSKPEFELIRSIAAAHFSETSSEFCITFRAEPLPSYEDCREFMLMQSSRHPEDDQYEPDLY